MKKRRKDTLSAEEMEFLPAALEVVERPPSPIGRIIIWVMILAFLTALIWSVVGSVDEVSVATGKVIPSGNSKTIQAENKGTVTAIAVKDGDHVKAGDTLLELDGTSAEADRNALCKQRANIRLEMERLTAECTGKDFAPKLDEFLTDEDISIQTSLYHQRKQMLAMRLFQLKEEGQAVKENIGTSSAIQEKLRQQLEIAADKEARMKELLEGEAISSFSYQDYREKTIELEQDLAAQKRELASRYAESSENEAKIQSVVTEYQQDNIARLAEDRNKLKTMEEEIRKAEDRCRSLRITAPVDGIVQQMQVHTIGGVVEEAAPLMVIVPDEADLEMEVWVDNQDIGFVHQGQTAEIKVTTFDFQKYGTLTATVTNVSTDAEEKKDKGLVYRAICKTDHDTISAKNETLHLAPGMAVSAEIKTRKKKIIEYFMDPFIKYKDEGLRER